MPCKLGRASCEPIRAHAYLEKECGAAGRNEEEDGGEKVGKGIGEGLEKGNVAKEVGVLLGGLGEEAAKGRADDGAERPDKRHDGKGARLQFSLRDHFCYHGPDDSDYIELAKLKILLCVCMCARACVCMYMCARLGGVSVYFNVKKTYHFRYHHLG